MGRLFSKNDPTLDEERRRAAQLHFPKPNVSLLDWTAGTPEQVADCLADQFKAGKPDRQGMLHMFGGKPGEEILIDAKFFYEQRRMAMLAYVSDYLKPYVDEFTGLECPGRLEELPDGTIRRRLRPTMVAIADPLGVLTDDEYTERPPDIVGGMNDVVYVKQGPLADEALRKVARANAYHRKALTRAKLNEILEDAGITTADAAEAALQ